MLLAQAPFQASVRQIAIDPTGPDRMLALTRTPAGNDFLYRTEDGGISWRQTVAAPSVQAVFFDSVAADTAYLLFGEGPTEHLSRSEAGGALSDIDDAYSAWASPEGTLYWAKDISCRYPFPYPFPCVKSELFASATQGQTLAAVGPGVVLDSSSVAYAPGDSSVAYATSDNEPLLASADGGVTWTKVSSGDLTEIVEAAPTRWVGGIAVDPLDSATIFLTVIANDASAGLLLRSDDGGAHWSGMPVPEPPTGPLAIGASDRLLYLGTLQGVFRLPLGRTRTLSPR
jgi:photosystem II stability/assembly factor-like uncharacterized protein